MASNSGNLILFGGLHDIVYEINDFYVFKIQERKWIEIESASSRQHDSSEKLFFEKSATNTLGNSYEENENNSELRKIKAFQNNKKFHKKGPATKVIPSSKVNVSQSILIRDSISPVQLKQERKKREMQEKKKKLLKEFAFDEEELANSKREKSPTTEALRNSLLMIKQPNKKLNAHPKTNSLIISKSKIEKPITRPLARDGHSLIIEGDNMYVFGGDRHKMTFGDLFKLDLKSINGKL